VWERDGGRCAFVGKRGRCTATAPLEFHHIDPRAAGGPPTVANLQLRCRTHNQYQAQQDFPKEPRAAAGNGGKVRSRRKPP
jgi:hypothetical protein